MKLVKKSISLPKDLFKFAEDEAERLAKERGGSQKNISAYLRELLAGERKRVAQPETQIAA